MSEAKTLSRVTAELDRQAMMLTTATDAARQHIAALSKLEANSDSWAAAATSADVLCNALMRATIGASTAGTSLMLNVLERSTQPQRTRLAAALGTLAEAIEAARATLAETLSLPWPAHLCIDGVAHVPPPMPGAHHTSHAIH